MSQPLISVVIPAYNAAKTLKTTVQSVFDQTVQDFEIIIVDDGSKDNTVEVANSIGDPRVRVISQPNGGASAARNTGIEAAIGKYVAFLDADDLWLPYKLERQIARLKSSPEMTAVQSDVFFVNDSLRVISVGACFESKDALLETLFFLNLPGLMSTLVVERSQFAKIGLLDTSLVILEDWELAIRLARYCNLTTIVEPLALYRQHPGNRSSDLSIHIEPGHLALGRLFADETLPPHIKRLESQIYAAFYTMLCGGAFRVGHYAESLKWGVKGITKHPAAIGRILAMPLRRMKRRSSAVNVTPEQLSLIGKLADSAS